MTSAHLLDVNVLLALAWPNHQHHAIARRWFVAKPERCWASCAVTQLGFVRLSSNPAFTDQAVTPDQALALLQHWTTLPGHEFWPSSALAPEILRRAQGHRQVTDAWLLQLAAEQQGKLATLDRRLRHLHRTGDEIVELILV